MAKEINTIAVLTSGGDAPGMNAVVRAVVRQALTMGKKVKGIQRGYGGSIPPQAGSKGRTGQGQEREGKEIEETGCGYQPAVGWKILTNIMKAMTHNAPWPILFC